jgi:hypothetical protein
MSYKLVQSYGPILDSTPSIKHFLWISEQAFIRTAELIGNDAKDWNNPNARVIQALMYHALNTSLSIRILTTNAQTLEAFALLRMRLEQLIVSSYLLHSKDGFDAFIADLSRVDYRAVNNLQKDQTLKSMVESFFGDRISNVTEKAIEAEKIKDPLFDTVTGQIKRKWTTLSTYDLAIARDKLISSDDSISSTKLGWFYISIYKTASILLHSDTGIITNNYLDIAPDKLPAPQLGYFFLDLLNNAHFDIIQCYEIVKYFKKSDAYKVAELLSELKTAANRPL